MFDAVDPIVMPVANTSECPACGISFKRKRSNQTYCSRPCQRKTTRNSARGDRSAENKQRSSKHYERAARLTEMIYTTPPQERLGMMKHILSLIPHDAGLRNILTDQKLLKEPPRANNRTNISKAANAYTQKFFGISITRYLEAVCAGTETEPAHQQSIQQNHKETQE